MRYSRPRGAARALAAALAACALAGCHHDTTVRVADTANKSAINITFTDVSRRAGIDFHHVNGAFGRKWLPETMGSGVAWIDYDGDGYQDLFLVNSRPWTQAERVSAHLPPGPPPVMTTCKLYHNNGDGTFTDVTHKAHLDIPMYGMGVTVGDYDNDGHPDLYVTALGRNYLFHNNGDGTFTDVARQAGVEDGGWSTSAAWIDYDRDGKLDLLVCHYVHWTPATDVPCPRNGHDTYCTPAQYTGEPLSLYHNLGGGRFENVSAKAGLLKGSDGRKLQGKSLGVTVLDYDGDGYPDFAIANDTEPNYLFHNEHDGTFKEVGVEQGMAFGDTGAARGAMGIDAADYDRKGHPSLVIGNFSNQMLALYHNDGAIFRDVAPMAGVGQPSLLSLSFGCFFADLDNDGWQDLFVANGHIDDDIGEVEKEVTYSEKPLIFHNLGNGNFANVSDQVGPDMQKPMVARGAAYADYDLRGVLDIAVNTNNGPAHLFRNSGNPANHSIRLELEGTKSNRSAIGAVVTVMAAGQTQTCYVRSGSSYCSQSELPLTCGLGPATQADTVTIQWPSGESTTLNSLAAGKYYHVVEGKGIAWSRQLGAGKGVQSAMR